MIKRTLIVLSLTLVIVIGVDPLQVAYSIAMTETEVAMLNAFAPTPTTLGDSQEKRGNVFVRALKAPFKAIGRLFGRGKKDDNKLHRLSEKDVKKFETAKVTRIVDATSPPAPAMGENATASALANPLGEAALTESQAKQARAVQHLEQGRELLENGNLNEAIACFSLATSLDAKLNEAHNLLGVAYEGKGMRMLALKSLELALQGENDQAEHLNNFGYLLSKNGRYERALKYLKRAVKLAPNEQRFLNNLGMVQAELGNFDDAYKSFDRAVGEFEGRMNVANRAQRLGHDKEAIKHLEKARALQPNTLDILHRLAVLYTRTGKQEEAAEARTSLVTVQALANVTTQ